jgi:hypothetical protein
MVNLESWKLHTTPSNSYKRFIEIITRIAALLSAEKQSTVVVAEIFPQEADFLSHWRHFDRKPFPRAYGRSAHHNTTKSPFP